MKTIHRTLLISMMPVLTTLSVSAQPEKATTNLTSNESDHSLSTAWWASDVIGIDVKNSEDQSIGEVKDIAIDLKNGEILAVVISSGGFLGIADTLSSVPCSVLRYDSATKSFKTKLTKQQLQNAPQHKAGEKPDYSDAALMTKLHEYRDSVSSNMKSATDSTAADNTARNKVDAKEATITPVDQGNSDADLKTTKDLRSAVMDSDLSFNAKNIKIITRDGHVTLRGVVDSSAEHDAVVKIVGKHVDAAEVTDSLTTK